MTTRNRQIAGRDYAGAYYRPNGDLFAGSESNVKYSGFQTTESEGHPFNKPVGGDFAALRKPAADLSDLGGPFRTSKTEVIGGPKKKREIEFDGGFLGTLIYRGRYGIIPETFPGFNPSDPFPPDISSSSDDLIEAGTTAIARTEPTQSVADLSTALGELAKDGLPDLPLIKSLKRRTKIAVDAGSEFLNYAFGWAPLVKDVTSVANAVQQHEEILSQFERDSGRVVRRRYYFPEDTTLEVSDGYPSTLYCDGGNLTNFFDPGQVGLIYRTRRTVRRRWFSGAFTYYLPSDYESRNAMRKNLYQAKKLLGVQLTPETLWNLAPWSWAADWVSNSGDVAHNVSAFASNGLVLRYGYIMETTISTDRYEWVGNSPFAPSRSITFKRTVKQRLPATPYGFGVSWEGLSTFQSAVLGALGISRRH